MKVVLASTSPYRRKQLQDFGLLFEAHAPKVNEDELKTNLLKKKTSPQKLAAILARKKAESLLSDFPEALIIGGDQLVRLGKKILGKPNTPENAVKMLSAMSGKTHQLITCISVVTNSKKIDAAVVAQIKMRNLTKAEIIAYVERDSPLRSAGSYMFEKSGFGLVEKITVSDPSSLTGVPLIALTKLFLKLKMPIPYR